ncbi:bifunctional diguanylate cyclase/phosphodiesterase [Mycobacterium sp. AZCC_0083]|uniref:putative bifunctional diguanylate cyclase/phosphodiesterase n=1 Tax=Mycobacterium sp. AZCC_0083 TaxID=2735882 RepID=UPI00161DFA75|nr:bifunctional diguanylate cyclase/phosphodiesterase [Mycobacterium sp. AZCC_0083]MBB5168551.1 diguanylate cyclase (GGDEF)-like protein [Mycobacterium sp. AZCC_0083]
MSKIAWAAGIATGTAIVFAAWLIGGWGGESTVRVVDDLGLIVFAVFATVCAGLAAQAARGRQRSAWICLTVGLGGWAVGEVIWAYYQLVLGMEESPFPSVADIAYLMFPIGACLALVLFPVGYTSSSRVRLVLDGLIVAGALFAMSWVLVLQSLFEAGVESRFAAGVSFAYPVTDIVVVTVALLVLGRAHTGQRLTLLLLTAGSVLNALSDSAFAYLTANDTYFSGSVIDVGWVAALLMLSMAALVSLRAPHTEERKAEVTSRASMWLPYLPLVPAAVVCGPKFMPIPGLGPVIATSMLLMIAVLARQFVVVGENRRLLDVVADQALRDPLTGLANRALFHDRLTHAMQLHQRDEQSVTVLSLDLDDFKLVNDSLGHPAGDALLALAAERILGCVRTGDTVARLGGDEFAVLMEGPSEHSRFVAHRVMQAFDEPFVVDGHDLLLRPSVGLAVAPADGPDLSAEALLKQADVAMYSAKRSRTGGVHNFTADMHLIDSGKFHGSGGRTGASAVRLLGQLRHAVDHGDLSVVYQPKFDLRSAEIVGVEALVRWPHPELGVLGPERFLPLVRQHGLMRAVTEVVLVRALDDAAHWKGRAVGVPVAINIFAPSMGSLDLPTKIAHALAERGLGAGTLTVEITEDLFLDDIERTRTVLHRLREHGVRIAIDDFGSGYSALCYLRELPIDELKLDKQFIAPILVDRRAAAVVRAVVDLAHVLGVTTVAEGVENAETAFTLRECGCEVAQGFYFSPPVSADAIFGMVSEARSVSRSRPVPA